MTLSTRIAALEGPDRAIDADIAKSFGWLVIVDGRLQREWRTPDGRGYSVLPYFTASVDAALSIVQPSMQSHVMHEALKLVGTRGEIVGKYPEQLARAICEVALRERGL